MSRFNTGNNIGSLAEEDMYDNCLSLDEAMNSTNPTWRDRFNVEKPTIDAALKSAGFMPAGFDFVTGGTLQPGDRNKAVYNPTPNGDNNWYRWNGVFPKEIAANSQPNPKDENNWVLAHFRIGIVEKEALRRSYAEAGYNLVDGSFEAGGTVATTTDVLLYEANGKAYSWDGALPKAVAPGSTPIGTGGIAQGAWLSVGDAALRSALADPNKGAAMVAYSYPSLDSTPRPLRDKLADTISSFDYMTSAEIQAVRSSDTSVDLTDSLQKAIDEANKGGIPKTLVISPGLYKITRPLVIPPKGFGNFRIVGYAARLKAFGFSGHMLIGETTSYNGNNLTIEGLILDGSYTAKGILLKFYQEWNLHNVKIWNCFHGVELLDTYYGNFTGECIIRNCLHGMVLGDYSSGEVNTIGMDGIKINFATPKTNFVPMLPEESNEAYNERVQSIGVDLRGIVLGINFECIFEGMDHGIYGIREGLGGTGYNSHKFSIKGSYFEAIKTSPITLIEHEGYLNLAGLNVTIEDNWFASGTPPIRIQTGRVRIIGNGNYAKLLVKPSIGGGLRLSLETDISPEFITYETMASTQMTTVRHRPLSANALKYANYNSTNVYPAPLTMLPTMEDADGIIVPSRVRQSSTGFVSRVNTVTTKPVTFASRRGALEFLSGPVIQGEDNNYYMIGTKDGAGLVLKRVYNLHRLDPIPGAKTAMEMYKDTSLPAGTYTCIDLLGLDVVKRADGKFVKHNDLNYITIGSTAEAIAQPQGASWWSPLYWNIQINRGYNWQGSYWAWGPDWYGETTSIRAIGLLSQRPTSPLVSFMIYYATDTSEYSQWNGSAWGAHTPIF